MTKTTKVKHESQANLIRISTSASNAGQDTRGYLDSASQKLNTVALVASDKLAQNLEKFSEQFGKALAAVARSTGDYDLDEVKVSVELGVEGEVTLLGSGASASGTAGLELVFKRRAPKQ